MKRLGWKLFLGAFALIWLLPLGSLLFKAMGSPGASWAHLESTVLWDYIGNSLILVLGTLLVSGFLGALAAWVTVRYNFPGKKVFVFFQLLPLTVPAFLGAASWRYFLEYTGPLGTFFRSLGFPWFLSPPSGLLMGIILLGIALYPYVFLTLRPVFSHLNPHFLDTARMGGWSRKRIFFFLVLPLVRPALIGGLSLVAMESLNEYGLPSLLGFSTFTTGIFQTWFGLGDLGTALQLAMVLLGVWVVFFILERWGRGQKQFSTGASERLGDKPVKAPRFLTWGIWTLGTLPMVVGFFVPLGQMVHWLFYLRDASFYQLGSHVFTTLGILVIAGGVGIVITILAVFGRLLLRPVWSGPLRYLIPLGYALPGAILALAVMSLGGTWLIGTWGGLALALVMRFAGVGLPVLQSSARQLGKNTLDAAVTMGKSPFSALRKVLLPPWAPALLASICLMAVDILKELPMTMVLRPFNFQTLATRTFELIQNEIPMDSAPSGILLVFLAITFAWLGQTLLERRSRGA